MTNNNNKKTDLQVFQSGQVSEGPFFNNPQTVDVLHRTAGAEMSKENISNYSDCCQLLSTNKPTKQTDEAMNSSVALEVKD